MKIIYIRLENYIGVFTGMNRKSIEINFEEGLNKENILTNNNNNISIFIGENGSGKSTVQTALHPFAGTSDERKKIIRLGKNGLKEIHIRHDKDIYKIIHQYIPSKDTHKMRSFINKIDENGEETELNMNGGVTTFKDNIKEIFGIDESFLKIGRISSASTSFIDLPKGERKKYISNFLPDIDIFLNYFKTLKEIHSRLEKEIKYVSDEIDKLDDSDVLSNRDEYLTTTIDSKEKELIELKTLQSTTKIKMQEIEKEFIDNNLSKLDNPNRIFDIINSKQKAFDILKENVNLTLQSFDGEVTMENVGDSIISIKNEIQSLLTSSNVLREKLSEKNKLEKNLLEQIKKIDNRIQRYRNDILELEKIQNSKIEIEGKINDIKKSTDLSLYELIRDNYSDFISFTRELDGLTTILKEEIPYFDRNGIDYIFMKDNYPIYENNQKVLNKKEIEKETIQSSIIKTSSDINAIGNIMKNIPDTCRDKCAEFDSTLDTTQLLKLNEDYNTSLNSLNIDIEEISNDVNFYSEHLGRMNNILNIHKKLFIENKNTLFTTLIDIIDEEMTSQITIENFFTYIMNNKDLLNYLNSDKFIEVYNNGKTYEALIQQVEKYDASLKILNDNTSFDSKIEEERNKLYEQLTNVKKDLRQWECELHDEVQNVDEYNGLLSALEEVNKYKEEYDSFSNEMEKLNLLNQTFSTLLEKNSLINENFENVSSSIKSEEFTLENYRQEHNVIQLKLLRKQEFEERKNKLITKFSPVKMFRDACNPISGLPSKMINKFLEPTKVLTNQLLDIAYKGNFKIVEFVINEKEFAIPVINKDNTLLDDIIDASQGETALSRISISLAIVKNSTKYNIVSFDEMDSTLDSNKRGDFVSIIDRLIETLNMEQLFLISHNDAFSSNNVSVVLFPGGEYDIENSGDKNLILSDFR